MKLPDPSFINFRGVCKANLRNTYKFDVVSLNKFNYYIDVTYPAELEIKDTTDDPKWANYLHHMEFDEDGRFDT